MNQHTIEFKNLKNYIPLAFGSDEIAICFSCSNEYARFASVTIESIIENSDRNKNYDILILEHNISLRQKKKLLTMLDKNRNFSLRFINLSNEIATLKVSTWAHFSIVACFKLFLFSDAFSNYQKICVFDTDLIFLKDVSLLFNKSLEGFDLLACDDVIMKNHVKHNKFSPGFSPRMTVKTYLKDYLGLGTDSCYYNTGVCVLNLNNCRHKDYFKKGFFLLSQKGYSYQEQDVLNELCFKNSMRLEYNWNVVGTENYDTIYKDLNEPYASAYKEAVNNPFVLHFAGGGKPWNIPGLPFAEQFFRYARNTPFYEELIANMMQVSIEQSKQNNQPVPKMRSSSNKSFFLKLKNIVKDKNKYKLNSVYISSLNQKIIPNTVLLDSKNGTDLAGNIFRILKELEKNYGSLILYLTYRDTSKERITSILNANNIKKVKLVKWESLEFFRILGRANYVITDLYVISQYVKRDNQILISTAHGTPIKTMGKDCHTETQGHLQRTHVTADYQIFPSEYMKSKLFNGFMENNLFIGKALKMGYPRNDIFFDSKSRNDIRQKYGWENKRVYAYLPTFRGIAGKFRDNDQISDVLQMCEYLDSKMASDQLLLVKLHNFVSEKIDLSAFEHIEQFPDDNEVYEILNSTDLLISDYSSVFFDYANTHNKIILYQYDKEIYDNERGTYLNWNDLPFPIVSNLEELWTEINSGKHYDDSNFLNKYCTFDNEQSTKNICTAIFNKGEIQCFDSSRNERKNIFIHVGNLDVRQYPTVLVQELVKELYNAGYNCFIYSFEYCIFNRPKFVQNLYPYTEYFTFLNYPMISYKEYLMVKLNGFFKHKYLLPKSVTERECRRNFVDLPIDFYLDLVGNDETTLQISQHLECTKVIVTDAENINKIELFRNKFERILTYTDECNTDEEESIVKSYSHDGILQNCKKLAKLIETLMQ